MRDALAEFNARGEGAATRIEARLVHALPGWPTRGIAPERAPGETPAAQGPHWSHALRCDPRRDQTGGFFVAIIHKFAVGERAEALACVEAAAGAAAGKPKGKAGGERK